MYKMTKACTHTYTRMFMYVLTLVLHVCNKIVIDARYNEISDDPDIKAYYPLRNMYFTGWIVFMHMVYSVVGLVCEGLRLKHSSGTEYKLSKTLKRTKEFLFSVFIWPSTWVVFLVFWILYYYNRHLVCPLFVDKLVSSNSNHIMHTFILPFVLLELYFESRTVPASHKRNLTYLSIFYWSYYALSMYTYWTSGVWLYPIYGVLYGTFYFYMIPTTVYVIILAAYFAQWIATSGSSRGETKQPHYLFTSQESTKAK